MSLANEMRRMADWIDAHPGVEDELMYARVGKLEQPRISLYDSEILHKAFPGREASITREGDHRVTELVVDGIRFDAWEMIRDLPPEPKKVVLGEQVAEVV